MKKFSLLLILFIAPLFFLALPNDAEADCTWTCGYPLAICGGSGGQYFCHDTASNCESSTGDSCGNYSSMCHSDCGRNDCANAGISTGDTYPGDPSTPCDPAVESCGTTAVACSWLQNTGSYDGTCDDDNYEEEIQTRVYDIEPNCPGNDTPNIRYCCPTPPPADITVTVDGSTYSSGPVPVDVETDALTVDWYFTPTGDYYSCTFNITLPAGSGATGPETFSGPQVGVGIGPNLNYPNLYPVTANLQQYHQPINGSIDWAGGQIGTPGIAGGRNQTFYHTYSVTCSSAHPGGGSCIGRTDSITVKPIPRPLTATLQITDPVPTPNPIDVRTPVRHEATVTGGVPLFRPSAISKRRYNLTWLDELSQYGTGVYPDNTPPGNTAPDEPGRNQYYYKSFERIFAVTKAWSTSFRVVDRWGSSTVSNTINFDTNDTVNPQ